MQEKIIEKLKKINRKISLIDLINELKLSKVEDIKQFHEEIINLEKKGEIITNKNKVIMVDKTNLIKGKLMVNRSGNFGFVDMGMDVFGKEREDIRIEREDFNGAENNDIVLLDHVTIREKTRFNKKWYVRQIIQKDSQNLVGEVISKDGLLYIKFDNSRYNDLLLEEGSQGVVLGSKVQIKRVEDKNNHLKAEIIKVIGHKDDVGMDVLSIVYSNNIPIEFSQETLDSLKEIPNIVSEEEIKGRIDLRDQVIFTIDGDGAKDFDDAVQIEKTKNNTYLLGVHIADVSHYVKEGSFLDKDALTRGNSVYLTDRVIPMLPHLLSNGICSLNEGVDRLTFSVTMEIDEDGNILEYKIHESVIKSSKRMTYAKVNEFLEKGIVPEGYEQFTNKLLLMKELSEKLRRNKESRGYLDFNNPEMEIEVDSEGKPIAISKRNMGIGENLIEDFMIAANEAVATYASQNDFPLIYRIHGSPDYQKVEDFIKLLNSLGIRIKGSHKENLSKRMQQILNAIEEENIPVLSKRALIIMKKAIYSTDNIGHFGLGLTDYAHFTSPIRRYPDLMVHRSLKAALTIKDYNKKYLKTELQNIANHTSLTEANSVNCERDVEKIKSAEYMEKHIGEDFEAWIVNVGREGIWVQLDNLIEGLIRMREIGNDYFELNEEMQYVKARRSGVMYRIGQRIKVTLVGSSKESGEIDFILTKNNVKRGDENGNIKQKS